MLLAHVYHVRQEQAMGTDDVKVTAMNMTCTSTRRGCVFANVGHVALIFEKT